MRVSHESLTARVARLAAAASALKAASGTNPPFSLAFLTDRRRISDPEPVLRALPPGAAVIYRDYRDPARGAVARRYRAICGDRGVFFLVAADEALARAVGADGLHLPSRMLAPSGLSSPAGGRAGRFFLTASCHDAAELARAAASGADLALLGPVFSTKSHPHTEPLGPQRFKALAAASPLPVLALGGIDEANAPEIRGHNVSGLAAIGAFADAREP